MINITELSFWRNVINNKTLFWLFLQHFVAYKDFVENTAPLHADFPTIAWANDSIFQNFRRVCYPKRDNSYM